MKKDVFLCHASEDKPMVRSVALGLERYNISTWLDEAEMHPGDCLVDKISGAIEAAERFCAFLSPNSIDKKWVKFELHQAMQEQVETGRSFIVPVLLLDCAVPYFLKPYFYVDLRNWDSYGFALESLAVAILGEITEVPDDFVMSNLPHDLPEDKIMSLPSAQAAIELKLRYDKWASRRIGTLRNLSSLTLKQVITYCERQPHIVANPVVSDRGDILYGVRWRVMEQYDDEQHYQQCVRRYLLMMTRIPIDTCKKDVIEYFLTFYSNRT